jgi:phage FluMu protein Com
MSLEIKTKLQEQQFQPNEARCECGHLIAKIRDGNFELKCKRCKRIVFIPYASIKDHEVSISTCGS